MIQHAGLGYRRDLAEDFPLAFRRQPDTLYRSRPPKIG